MQKVIIGTATLYQGDCMELMATLSDKSFDLAIVDPPYGIGENGDKAKSRNRFISNDYKSFAGDDVEPPPIEYFLQLERCTKNQIIWGANHFASRLKDPSSSCWIVWDKVTGNSDFADSELAYTSFETAVRNFRFQWSGMLQGDMKNKEVRIHPTQKPVKLYEWLLTNYAKQGQTILDTHLGSGSSAIAANKFGFQFTGIELDKDYFNAACARIEKALSQVDMFAPAVEKPEQHSMFNEAA